MKDEVIVLPILENLSLISEFLQEKVKESHLATRKAWELLLAADEICTHIIQFRKYDCTMGKMKVIWNGCPDKVVITIETTGIPFNPLELNNIEETKEEEEEALGGMGIHLVKQMVDEYIYTRTNSSNVIKLVKFRKARKNKIEK